MTLRLNGATSGYTEIDAPAVAGSNTLKLPGGNGTADQALVTDGSGVLSFADRGRMVLGTSQASTSGTSIDFTGIPSWAKRVSVLFSEVGFAAGGTFLVQIGAASLVTSGYTSNVSVASALTNTVSHATSTAGFVICNQSNAGTLNAVMTLSNVSGNTWLSTHHGIMSSWSVVGGGSHTLGGALTQLRVTSSNATTFDSGSINILYEG